MGPQETYCIIILCHCLCLQCIEQKALKALIPLALRIQSKLFNLSWMGPCLILQTPIMT